MKINGHELTEWQDANLEFHTNRYALNADHEIDVIVIRYGIAHAYGKLSFIDKYINNIKCASEEELKKEVDKILFQLAKFGVFI